MEVTMLKLSLKPGEYIDIGENIRVVFSGGSANNIHLLVDAPREYNIVRSNSMKQKDKKNTIVSRQSLRKQSVRLQES